MNNDSNNTIQIDVSEVKSPNEIVASVVKNMKQSLPYMPIQNLLDIVTESYDQFTQDHYFKYETITTYVNGRLVDNVRFKQVKPIPKRIKKSLDWFDYICKRALDDETYHPGTYRQTIIAYLFDCLLKHEGMSSELRLLN